MWRRSVADWEALMRKRTFAIVVAAFLVTMSASRASAQLLAGQRRSGDDRAPQLNKNNNGRPKEVLRDNPGGRGVKNRAKPEENHQFPDRFIFFRPMQAPTGGTRGTTVNHIGFSVPD